MAPIGLPESFSRRRSRAGSCDGIGELPGCATVMLEGKNVSCPAQTDSNRWLNASKSHDSLLPYTALADRGHSRDLSSSDAECEVQLTDTRAAEKQSLFRDLCQTQLSLWTFTVSTLLTYFWQKRVNLRSVLFACCAFTVTVFMSGVLAAVVMAAHLFNSDFAESFGGFGDWLGDGDNKYTQLVRRQSSSFRHKSNRRSSGGSGTSSPRSAEKVQQQRFWQKNVATLERSYIGSSRS